MKSLLISCSILLLAACGGASGGPDAGALDLDGGGDAGANVCLGSEALTNIATATALAHEQIPSANLVDVYGFPTAGPANSADDFDKWDYHFRSNDGTVRSVTVSCSGGPFGAPVVVDGAYVEVTDDPIPETMTLEQAIALLRTAGATQRIAIAELATPLNPIADRDHHAWWTFALEDNTSAHVDVVTSVVTH